MVESNYHHENIAQSKLELYKGDFPSEAQNVSMAICVCVLKSEQKEREFCPTLFHLLNSITTQPFPKQRGEKQNTHISHSQSSVTWIELCMRMLILGPFRSTQNVTVSVNVFVE